MFPLSPDLNRLKVCSRIVTYYFILFFFTYFIYNGENVYTPLLNFFFFFYLQINKIKKISEGLRALSVKKVSGKTIRDQQQPSYISFHTPNLILIEAF